MNESLLKGVSAYPGGVGVPVQGLMELYLFTKYHRITCNRYTINGHSESTKLVVPENASFSVTPNDLIMHTHTRRPDGRVKGGTKWRRRQLRSQPPAEQREQILRVDPATN